MLTTRERVDRLEIVFEQFMAQTGAAIERMDTMIARMERTAERGRVEARRDREEARQAREAFGEEARQAREAFGEEARQAREAFGEEARQAREAFREEARRDREEARKERRELARQLGDISNRLGTVVEDIVAPSLRRLAQDELNCGEIETFAFRLEKYHPTTRQRREFDVIVAGTEAVLFNQTKTTARPEYARDFADFLRSGEFFVYFPEYADKPLLPVFSSLHLPENIVTYLTRQGIYAVAMGEETMQVLNLEQVRASR